MKKTPQLLAVLPMEIYVRYYLITEMPYARSTESRDTYVLNYLIPDSILQHQDQLDSSL